VKSNVIERKANHLRTRARRRAAPHALCIRALPRARAYYIARIDCSSIAAFRSGASTWHRHRIARTVRRRHHLPAHAACCLFRRRHRRCCRHTALVEETAAHLTARRVYCTALPWLTRRPLPSLSEDDAFTTTHHINATLSEMAVRMTTLTCLYMPSSRGVKPSPIATRGRHGQGSEDGIVKRWAWRNGQSAASESYRRYAGLFDIILRVTRCRRCF